MFSDIFFTLFHDFLLSVTEKRASPRSLGGGGGGGGGDHPHRGWRGVSKAVFSL